MPRAGAVSFAAGPDDWRPATASTDASQESFDSEDAPPRARRLPPAPAQAPRAGGVVADPLEMWLNRELASSESMVLKAKRLKKTRKVSVSLGPGDYNPKFREIGAGADAGKQHWMFRGTRRRSVFATGALEQRAEEEAQAAAQAEAAADEKRKRAAKKEQERIARVREKIEKGFLFADGADAVELSRAAAENEARERAHRELGQRRREAVGKVKQCPQPFNSSGERFAYMEPRPSAEVNLDIAAENARNWRRAFRLSSTPRTTAEWALVSRDGPGKHTYASFRGMGELAASSPQRYAIMQSKARSESRVDLVDGPGPTTYDVAGRSASPPRRRRNQRVAFASTQPRFGGGPAGAGRRAARPLTADVDWNFDLRREDKQWTTRGVPFSSDESRSGNAADVYFPVGFFRGMELLTAETIDDAELELRLLQEMLMATAEGRHVDVPVAPDPEVAARAEEARRARVEARKRAAAMSVAVIDEGDDEGAPDFDLSDTTASTRTMIRTLNKSRPLHAPKRLGPLAEKLIEDRQAAYRNAQKYSSGPRAGPPRRRRRRVLPVTCRLVTGAPQALRLEPGATGADVRRLLAAKRRPVAGCDILFEGTVVRDADVLKEVGVVEHSTLRVVPSC